MFSVVLLLLLSLVVKKCNASKRLRKKTSIKICLKKHLMIALKYCVFIPIFSYYDIKVLKNSENDGNTTSVKYIEASCA